MQNMLKAWKTVDLGKENINSLLLKKIKYRNKLFNNDGVLITYDEKFGFPATNTDYVDYIKLKSILPGVIDSTQISLSPAWAGAIMKVIIQGWMQDFWPPRWQPI